MGADKEDQYNKEALANELRRRALVGPCAAEANAFKSSTSQANLQKVPEWSQCVGFDFKDLKCEEKNNCVLITVFLQMGACIFMHANPILRPFQGGFPEN